MAKRRASAPEANENHRKLLGLRSSDPWTGLFGVRTGEGKLTLGVRFPVKAGTNGVDPKIVITGVNPDTGLNTWDYDSEDLRDKWRVEGMVRAAKEDRKEERKSKALAKARAATIKGRRVRAAMGTMTIHDRVEIVRTMSRIEKL